MIATVFFIFCLYTSLSYAVDEKVNCDELGILIYEDLGCKPVYKNGPCPIKYDCNLEVKNNTCTFRGKSLPIGTRVDDKLTLGSCTVGCFCDQTNTFVCAILDCFDQSKPGCYNKYELGKCCAVGEICPSDTNQPAVCVVDGKEVLEGQKFFPKNTCSTCLCSKGYQGINRPPFCQRTSCLAQIHYSEQVRNYCAPFYDNSAEIVHCCPYNWICPSEADSPIKHNPKPCQNTGLTCKYGKKTLKLGDSLQTEIDNFDGTKRKVHCECVIPPLLSCQPL